VRVSAAGRYGCGLREASASPGAEPNVDGFVARTEKNAIGTRMPYRLFIPEHSSKSRSYPLILWLHGASGAGNDNLQRKVR
jgi:predicted peptidase